MMNNYDIDDGVILRQTAKFNAFITSDSCLKIGNKNKGLDPFSLVKLVIQMNTSHDKAITSHIDSGHLIIEDEYLAFAFEC